MPTTHAAQQFLSTIPGNGKDFIETALFKAHLQGPDCLAETFNLLHSHPRWRRGATSRDFLEAFDTIYEYALESPSQRLGEFARWRAKILTGQALKEHLRKRHGDDLTGVELFNGNYHALLLPDASERGRVRAMLFNEDGFSMHITFDTYDELISELIAHGFLKETKPSLDEMFTLDSFQRGLKEHPPMRAESLQV